MLVASALVFIMHLGFATLESGLSRAKNTINILFKNTVIPCIGLLTFALMGYGLMFPGFVAGTSMEFFGFAGFGIPLPENGETAAYNGKFTFWTDFLFQAMFAATCATIVSGAVAERVKLTAFLVFSFVYVMLVYPIIGSWKWGFGWLHTLGFYDFAGSTLVHSVGGCGALAGALLLGPRLGKFYKGRINPIPGHNVTSAVIGTFLLWLGWFGFNGGSVLSADPALVSKVILVTCLAAAAGGMSATLTIFTLSKNYDISMTLNGILSGLVAITAGADQMSPLDSIVIGTVGGVLVVVSVLVIDKMRIDDPVGAISVHLVNGIWGTLAVGLFGSLSGLPQLGAQLTGIVACNTTAFAAAFSIFFILKKSMGIRVDEEEEINGLDTYEHGIEAYPNFSLK
ncbi:MAG: ammonium transporter [Cytophagaceae bacterium]|nr:ammonium transporter [Cytophagaceae bacterium]